MMMMMMIIIIIIGYNPFFISWEGLVYNTMPVNTFCINKSFIKIPILLVYIQRSLNVYLDLDLYKELYSFT